MREPVSSERPKRDATPRPARTEARYANFFQIGHNAFEFLLEFGQGDSIHTRIYVSPQHARMLSDLLLETLQEHRRLGEAAALKVTPKPS